MKLQKEFPFVATTAVSGGPPGYQAIWVEPMAGLAVTFPFLWLLVGLPLINRSRSVGETTELRIMTASIAVMAAGGTALFLCFYCATTRYAVEFAVPWALLALMGWLGLERSAETRGRKIVVTTVAIVACAVTALVGVLLSFDYHSRALRTLSPLEWNKLEQLSNRLLGRAADHK